MHRCVAGIIVAVSTIATVSAQTLYLPAAANAPGTNQTQWKTDLQIKAQGDAGASFTIELLGSGLDNTDPPMIEYTIGAGESLRLDNVLDTEFGFTGTGALRVATTQGRVLATSRTFNDDPGGTYGQAVPAVADSEASTFGSIATLILLSRSPDPSTGFRTNVGFTNMVGTRTSMVIDLYTADGAPIDSLTRDLKPFEHRQVNDVFHAAGADDVPDGYAVVRTTSEGGRFIAYASVVDNGSGDAIFILGHTETTPTPPEPRLVVFEAFMRPG